MTTNKTIKSKNQPKQTNVTWVDLSGKTPVEKHFINGRWRPIGGGGGSVPKLSDFAILEPLTPEETELWEVANGGKKISDGYKLNKKVLEKLAYLSFSDKNDAWYTIYVSGITELDDAGNILAIMTNDEYMAKNSSGWEGTIVPDSASDDYFYRVTFQGPK